MKLENVKNVLLISHELSMTGAPIALHYLARQLKKDGIFTVVLSPKDGPLKNEIINDDFTVIVDDSITGSTEWLKWAKGFDLIVVNTVVIFHLINQLSSMEIPVLWWVHDGEMSFELGADKDLPITVGDNIHVVGVGRYTQKVLNKYRPQYGSGNLIYCVPDFMDDVKKDSCYSLDRKGKEFMFLNVGSVDKRKGQDILVDAIRKMPKNYREQSLFVFIGRKGDENVYQKVVHLQKEYPECITMIPEVSRDEIKSLYQQTTAVLCTSRDDPMPVFMTESMILSKPVICSENTGTYSLITDKKDGFVFHNEEELLDDIMYIIDNPAAGEQIGIQGRQIYERNFTEEAFKENFYEIVARI